MRVLSAYFMVILIWTTTPLAIQWSGQADWFFGVAARLTLSALLILPLLLVFNRQPFSFAWTDIKVYAAASLGLLGGMTPVYWAAQTMPSGWIALIWGLMPIVTGLMIYYLMAGQRIQLNQWLGILLSLIGLVIVFVPNLDPEFGSLQLLGLGVTLIGVFFHSLSTVLVKKSNHDLPPLHVITGALWITCLVYLIINPSFLIDWPPLSLQSGLAIGYLALIGSVLGFSLYYYVLKHMDALRLGMIPMITPVFALILGYGVNEEIINWSIALGAGLIIAGLLLFELNHLYRHAKLRRLFKSNTKPNPPS